MFDFHITRAARRRCHQAIVWAMVPLAVLNGRTLVACGCTGQFSSVCHCHAAGAGHIDARPKAASCTQCAAHAAATTVTESRACCTPQHQLAGSDKPDASRTIAGHHCRSLATYEVIPGTLVTSHADEHFAACDFLAVTLVEPFEFDLNRTAKAPGLDGHPPDDLIVVLHRLVI